MSDHRVEQAILNGLPEAIGPAAHYDVTVMGARRQDAGVIEMDRVHVLGARVQRRGAPVLDKVEADLTDVQVDRKQKMLTALTGADVRISVRATDVAAFLQERGVLEDVKVTFHESDVISITAHPVVAGFSLPASARVSLRGYLMPDGSQLRLNITDLRAAGYPVGTIPTLIVERLINPLVDLSALPVPTEVTSARVVGRDLIVAAHGSQFKAQPVRGALRDMY
ncbi:MAG: LmeA family phospholipid-binding protein [Betaproteobacteria bacterium]